MGCYILLIDKRQLPRITLHEKKKNREFRLGDTESEKLHVCLVIT